MKLTAAEGKTDALRDLTLSYLPRIRSAEGLDRVEFSKDLEDPTKYVLYYWWASPQASADYVKEFPDGGWEEFHEIMEASNMAAGN